MLKRPRPSSPIPFNVDNMDPADLNPVNLYQPDAKRRRYFASSSVAKVAHNAQDDEGDNESNISDEGVGSTSRTYDYVKGVREWQRHAGEYKDANGLLHDLHAEQRHRMMFTPSSTCNSHGSCSHAALDTKHSSTACARQEYENQSILDQDDSPATARHSPPSDEAVAVAQNYGNTNKLLRSLFLSRQKQLDQPQSRQ